MLAEFSSAVEAVRCAIDVQESLRTRNMAYPPSRQMNFRIGITIGDVVEREGDLLGDGVNIAARLEGIAPVGGICVSRNVYEQVANKLSVQFADIGEQQVKNIPNPVHAFTVAMRVRWRRPESSAAAARQEDRDAADRGHRRSRCDRDRRGRVFLRCSAGEASGGRCGRPLGAAGRRALHGSRRRRSSSSRKRYRWFPIATVRASATITWRRPATRRLPSVRAGGHF